MLPASGFGRALSEAAPSLSKRFFRCSSQKNSGVWTQAQAISRTRATATGASSVRARQFGTSPSSKNASSSRFRRSTALSSTGRSSRAGQHAKNGWARVFSASARSRAEAVAEAVGERVKSESKQQSFPGTSTNTVAYWLLGSAASVFGIVIFGGLTRLTESGLSITEWRPVTGSLPPRSQEDWESEFAKYRSSPEFKILNSRMTLEEFKSIYWMEWIHRLWGRVVGLSFVVPAVYFVARKKVSKRMAWNLFGIAGLIGFQGFLGWWMVKSGLKDDLFAPGSHPRVSQYRLTAHLGAAFVCYIAMLWNGLNILRTNKLLSQPAEKAQSALKILQHPALRGFKISVAALAGLVFVTAMSGGLVAGLDAGLIYNEIPYMGLGLAPPMSELFDKFYSHRDDHKDLIWRNFLENPSLVQLDHRILATTTFSAVVALFAWTRYSGALQKHLPRAAKKGVHGVLGFASLQVLLGITTLLYLVPTHLASAHQAGALALLTWTVVLGSRVWLPSRAVQKMVADRVLQGALAAGAKGPVQGQTGKLAAGAFATGGLGLVPLGMSCVGGDGMTTTTRRPNETPASPENPTLETQMIKFLQRQSAVSGASASR